MAKTEAMIVGGTVCEIEIQKGVGAVGFLGTALGLRNFFFFHTGQRGAGGLSFSILPVTQLVSLALPFFFSSP